MPVIPDPPTPPPGFDSTAVDTLVAKITSHALATGLFRSVNFHEPKSAPGTGLRLAVWADAIEPIGAASGLAAASGYVTVLARVYGNALTRPEDELDPKIMGAVTTLIGAYCGDFDFGETVRNVDILGAYGRKLMAQAGYVTIASTMYRVFTITLPVVVNDMWNEVG
jgi:hypothetical protein